MLRDRIFTALILIPLAIGVILLLPNAWLAAVFGVLVLLGAWEWARLAGLEKSGARAAYALAFVPLMFFAYRHDDLLDAWALPLGPADPNRK